MSPDINDQFGISGSAGSLSQSSSSDDTVAAVGSDSQVRTILTPQEMACLAAYVQLLLTPGYAIGLRRLLKQRGCSSKRVFEALKNISAFPDGVQLMRHDYDRELIKLGTLLALISHELRSLQCDDWDTSLSALTPHTLISRLDRAARADVSAFMVNSAWFAKTPRSY